MTDREKQIEAWILKAKDQILIDYDHYEPATLYLDHALNLLQEPCPKCAERRSLGVGEKCPDCKTLMQLEAVQAKLAEANGVNEMLKEKGIG